MKKRLQWNLAVVTAISFALSACGGAGGGETAPPPAATTPPITTPPITTPPPPSASVPADAGTAGTLPFQEFVFNTSGTAVTKSATITGSGLTSSMAFTDASPSFTLKNALDIAANWVWSANGGQVKADGNVVSYCSAGKQAVATGVEATDKPFMNGHHLYLSGNLQAVTDTSELKSLSFQKFDCAGSTGSIVFNANADGFTNTDASGTRTLSQADLAAFLSSTGKTESDGSNNTVRVFKYAKSGTTTKYFLVTFAKYSGGANSGGHITVYY